MRPLDERFMRRALALAGRGFGRTSPNPCVGAVLVRNGRVLGEGWHRAAGLPHAEAEAIADAQRRGALLEGATLYVTLEPCCTQGRTPPCTEAILTAGIRHVVAGATDPNPKHSGRGFRILRRAGVRVTTDVLASECSDLNRAWNQWITTGRPWVIAKCGMTLDGKIATADGESRWITSRASRRVAHELRAGADAVLVGVNTILADDPRLTPRGKAARGREPLRVVLDPRGRTPATARALKNGGACVVVSREIAEGTATRLRRAGARLLPVKCGRRGLDLQELLRALGRMGATSLLVEGGGATLGAFVSRKLVDEVAFFVAPRVLGGGASVKAVDGAGVQIWADSIALREMTVHRVGPDLLIRGRVATR